MSCTTPWGPSQHAKQLAPGIVRHHTAGHGGILLSPERQQGMPAALRSFVPFAGDGAYEEDCDWAVIALAWPEHFRPESVYNAVRAVQEAPGYFGAAVAAWLDSPQAANVKAIAAAWQAGAAGKYRVACCGSVPRRHEGLAQRAQRAMSSRTGLWWALLCRVPDGARAEALLTDDEMTKGDPIDIRALPAERILAVDPT